MPSPAPLPAGCSGTPRPFWLLPDHRHEHQPAWQAAGWLRPQRSPVAVAASPVSHESIRSDPTRLARPSAPAPRTPTPRHRPPTSTWCSRAASSRAIPSRPARSSSARATSRIRLRGRRRDQRRREAARGLPRPRRTAARRAPGKPALPAPFRGLLASADDITSENDSIEQLQSLQDENAAALRERLTPCASRWKPRPSQNPPKKTRASPRPRLRKATDPMSQPLLRAPFAPSSRSYVPAVLPQPGPRHPGGARRKQRRERLRPGRQPAGGALDDQPSGCRHPRIHRPDFRNHRRDLRRRPAGQGPGQRGLQGPALA